MTKKIDLKNYQKNQFNKIDSHVRSVNLERRHQLFLEKYRVNLSAFIRDAIDALMTETEKGKESKNGKKD